MPEKGARALVDHTASEEELASERISHDPQAPQHGQHDQAAIKVPPPDDEVPGVRGPAISPDVGPDVGAEPPEGPAVTWGSEGGAGVYRGAPVISVRSSTPTSGRSRRLSARSD